MRRLTGHSPMATGSFVLFLVFSQFWLSLENATAQSRPIKQGLPAFHVSASFGAGSAAENSLFNLEKRQVPENVVSDSPAEPQLMFAGAIQFEVSGTLGFGIQINGYSQKVDIAKADSLYFNYRRATHELLAYHLGANMRYYFQRGEIQPYVMAMIATANGTLAEEGEESLVYTGFSVGAGAGINIYLSRSFLFNFELNFISGKASWTRLPFVNSLSSEIDPSMAGLFIGFGYAFGN